MARYTHPMPDIGEGITEAEIVTWNKKVGDRVQEDEEVVDMMTDKATVPLESPVTGIIVEIAGEAGDMVAIGSPLFVVEVEGGGVEEAGEAPIAAAEDETPSPLQGRGGSAEGAEGVGDVASTIVQSDSPHPNPSPEGEGLSQPKVLASPAVRARAKDLGIDLARVQTAGRRPSAPRRSRRLHLLFRRLRRLWKARADETIKVIGLRKRIAENMAAAKRNIPHFTYVEECDVTALEETRAQLNEGRGERPKLTMLPLLIAAICKAIPDFPMINARYDDEARVVTRHGAVHLGMATMTPGGLMVPVIRDAQSRNLWQLASEIGRLAQAARDGSARSDELSGSTLTITSLGPLGGIATTPVINRPEVAIIGPNRIVERPMFVRGADGVERIEKRKLMNISISCDHRVVDGYDAAAFVQEVKKLLEAPARILAG